MLKNKTHRELLHLSKCIVQPLIPQFHKGQAGKVGVIGGCEDYTGAPFFLAHSAALVGADLSHVICEKLAAPVIKLYTPDLMIHPYLYELSNPDIEKYIDDSELRKLQSTSIEELLNSRQPKLDEIIDKRVMPKMVTLLNRMDVIIIGPGFGRDALMLKTLIRLIEEIRVLNKPIILDADALFLLSIKPSLIKNYSKAILTPNVVEFDRLAKALGIKNDLKNQELDHAVNSSLELSTKLGGVTVIRKGGQEVIAKNDQFLVNDVSGSLRRVGGQGDTLTGAIATYVNWAYNYQNKVWDSQEGKLTTDESVLLACFAACTTVRLASAKAYKQYSRSMQTSNVHEFLGQAYDDLFEAETLIKL